MLNLTEINENSQLLNADENQKKAIFTLIDLKTEQNMKEVILEIRALRTEMDSRFTTMEAKFSAMEIKFDSRFDTLQSRLTTLEKIVWGLLNSVALTIVSTIIIAIVNKFF